MDISIATLTISDTMGFQYFVDVEYKPWSGLAFAKYKGEIIADVELNKIREPNSDLDYEWEEYEERLNIWRDEIDVNIIAKCQEYFNSKQH